jgi:hypothetical protein
VAFEFPDRSLLNDQLGLPPPDQSDQPEIPFGDPPIVNPDPSQFRDDRRPRRPY